MTKILSSAESVDSAAVDSETQKLYSDILYGLLMDSVIFRNLLAAAGVGNSTLEVYFFYFPLF